MTSTPVLAVSNVSKSFAGVHAVQGVSFDVRPGEVFGFLGPNGAGKTTTLRMIMGITRPDSGSVMFEGARDIDRRRVGYLPEERGLFEDGTLVDTLVYLGTLRGMSRADARSEGKRWLERLELKDRLTSKVGTLSKGNQQKVQIIGAVIHKPALTVLDEPFSGLDPLNQELFLDLIRELRDRGSAVLLSAHQLNLAERLCDRFLLISRGRQLLAGTLDELRTAATGGSDEVLTVELRPSGERTAGAAIDLAVMVADLVPGSQCEGTDTGDGLVRLEVTLPRGADLGRVVTRLAERHRVERIATSALSLHQIYVRAVRADRASTPAEIEEATHV